ncbi:MAG: LysR family transcriptional regulator [Nitrospiraceae bacterium]|nr:LysR family transcriptional regulator [Nitrospiraceae bacterium]
MSKPSRRSHRSVSAKPDLRGRVWIDGPEGTFFGHGRAVLLERIIEYGSITKAAKSMKMAYRHAWDLVDSMNRQAKEPFVEVATGGRGGGGATVTAAGKRTIRLFWKFQKDLADFLKKEEKKLKL